MVGQDGAHARLLDLHRRLIALRRSRPELTDPAFDHTTAWADDAAKRFRMERGAPDAPERVVVAVNLGLVPWEVEFDGPADVLLTTGPSIADSIPADAMLALPGESAAILAVRRSS